MITTQMPPAYDGYRYMPAGISNGYYGGLMMYIRYGLSKTPSKIVVKQRNTRMVWIICPDREIVITRSEFTMNVETGFYPDQFDEALNLNLFYSDVSKDFDLNYIMQNYVEERNENHRAREFGNPDPLGKPDRVTIVSDSGGFQIATEKTDFISPIDLGNWYNKNTDIGMTIDIPITVDLPEKEVRELAEIQVRNTKLATSVMDDQTELIQITHGKSLESRRAYREVVETANPELNRIAYGGFGSFSPVAGAELLMDATYSGKRYSQYHLLGITSSSMLPLLAYVSNYGDNAPHLTSDSTSHLQAGISKGYYMNSRPGFLRATGIGMNARQHNTFSTLACSCPICSRVKYTDVLGVLSGRTITPLLFLHNIYQTNEYTKVIQSASKGLNTDEFMEFVKGTHATHSPSKQKNLISSLDFVRRSVDGSLKKAQKHHKESLKNTNNSRHSASNLGGGLFGGGDNEQNISYENKLERLSKLKDLFTTNLDRIEAGESVKGLSGTGKSKNRGGTQGT